MLTNLRWRLFASYLLIVLVGVITLLAAATFIAEIIFHSDIQNILSRYGSGAEGVAALNQAFTRGIQNALLVAAGASVGAAIAISIFVSGRVTRPLRELVKAANRVASGYYEERVHTPNIQEIAELARAFNQMATNLEQNERLRRELVSDLAHEIRTPLTAIQGYMEGLIDGVLTPDPAVFGRVQREARRLERLAQELGTLSELDAPRLKLKLERFAPGDVLQEVAGQVQPQFEFDGLLLQVQVKPPDAQATLGEVLADRDKLEQILINLLSNALRYTEIGGKVTLAVEREAALLKFSVQDSGIGIAPEHLLHIFERFYRVDKSRSRRGNTGGSGIGLTIVKRLVEAQGGTIWLESQLGQGTTVYFTLPAA